MEQGKKRKLEADQQPPKAATYNLSHFDLTTVPVTDVGVLNYSVDEILPQSKSDQLIEYYVAPSHAHWIALEEIFHYLNLSAKTSSNTSLPPTSKTSITNLIHSSFFEIVDIFIDSIPITSGANNYSFSSYMNKFFFNDRNAINTRFQTEGLFISNKETFTDDDNEAYKSLKTLAQSKTFETYGKISHALFEAPRYLPPGHSITIRMRIAPNTFYLTGKGLGANESLTTKLVINKCALFVKKIIAHSVVDMNCNAALNSNRLLSIPLYEYIATSFVIPKDQLNFTSEVLLNVLPSYAAFGMVSTKSFFGTYEDSPYQFKHYGLVNYRLTLNGEDLLPTNSRISVTDNEIMRPYHQLINTENDKGEKCCNVSLQEYKNFGYFFVTLWDSNGQKKDRYSLNRTGSVRLHLTFRENLTENVSVIFYYHMPKLLQFDKSNLFIKTNFSEEN